MASRAPIISTPSKRKEPEKQVSRDGQDKSTEFEERIRLRAYEIYLERGSQGGSDLDDWLRAEREILNR